MEMKMEGGEREILAPASPLGQYLNSSVLSLTIFGVLDFQVPIHDLRMSLIDELFLSINPRFSCIMVSDKNGVKKWKRVEVNVKEHFHVPKFPEGLSPEEYEECLGNYLSKIAMEPLAQNKPMWEIHKITYPTTNGAGSVIFKLHHALGDGYSLVGALLSCFKRVDNPFLPLTFPSRRSTSYPSSDNNNSENGKSNFLFLKNASRISSTVVSSMLDFGRSLLKSSVVVDDESPVRSGDDGVEFRPLAITTMSFSLNHIKQITTNLKVTINDVITGATLLGVRMYMEGESKKSSSANTTALVLLNTRDIDGYKSVKEMVKPKAATPWGNQFAFLNLSLPKISTFDRPDPLDFVFQTHQTVNRMKNNFSAVLIGQFLEICRKIKGPEATAKCLYNSMRNSSMTMSNLIGPMEHMSLDNHPVNRLYFTASGLPQSLTVALISYAGTLTATIAAEKGFIDLHKLKSCIQKAYDMIFEAAVHSAH